MTRAPDTTLGRAVRIVGVVLTVLVGFPFVLFAWMALSSRFEWGASDPHGYGLIFGTILALLAGLILAIVVPMMFRREHRGSAYRGSLIAYLGVAAALIISLLTA